MRKRFLTRVRLIAGCISLFALVLIGRLYFIQIVQGDTFSDRADHQYVQGGQSLYDRGSIFFEDKDGHLVSGATLKTGFLVALTPKLVASAESAYEALKTVVTMPKEEFLARASKTEDPYEEVARQVDPSQVKNIEEEKPAGVNLYKERWRFYPGGSLAAQSIGFVAYDGDELTGRYGLERYYEDVLARDSAGAYVNFFAEIFGDLNKAIFERTLGEEGDLITSIEPTVQISLERTLAKVQDTWHSKETGGVIIDPKTGEIYALASVPSFNANDFEHVSNASVFSNPIVESVYEMGSIIKPLTMAAGIDSGAVTPETTYVDNGFVKIADATIRNFDGQGRGRVSMQEVLNQSLNTGVVFIVDKMGGDNFAHYFEKLGIGEETGIDLPNEAHGLVDNLEDGGPVEHATASFGQGIALTPIATVRALTAIANGGVPATPHLVKKIKFENGLSKTVSYPPQPQVFSKETTEDVTRMLVKVVDTALINGEAKLLHYTVAAKTGTAQIARVGERGYYDDRFLHSFFGYFPAYDPKFLVFLYTVEPEGVRYASQTLTHPFMDLSQFLINYYQVPPDR